MGPELADHVFPVQSGFRSTVIMKMLMGLTVRSPRKASNVSLIRRHPEDILCGIIIQNYVWPESPHNSLFSLKPHIHDT